MNKKTTNSYRIATIQVLVWFVVFLFLSPNTQAQSNKDNQSAINEDVSQYRLKYTTAADQLEGTSDAQTSTDSQPVNTKLDVTKQLKVKLDTMTVRNKKLKYAQGYRVLVYTGNSSEEVKKVKDKVQLLLPDEIIYNVYKQPTFRVKIGDCYTRVEASSILVKIQKEFPNAIIVPDQINIVKETK